jgi:hypothetical protein
MKIIPAILLALSFSASAESTYLYTEVSQPGETMDAFVVRIAPRAISVTREMRVEICGSLASSEFSHSIRMVTSHTRSHCNLLLSDTESAYNPSGRTFHTHTDDEDSHRGFSPQDFNRPNGYVAYGKVVRYQEGKTKDRLISIR